jgi:hypothetical protein
MIPIAPFQKFYKTSQRYLLATPGASVLSTTLMINRENAS